MEPRMQKWQRSMIRNNLDRYREAMEHYHVKNKPIVELPDGRKAFSLLSPVLDSPAARRRIRFILKSVIDDKTVVAADGGVTWGRRTPHFITVAVTYACQCMCDHCSAETYKNAVARDGSALSVDELKDAIAQAIDLGTTSVVLTGGEPLLYDGIYDLIESVDPDKSTCTLFTNGEYLTQDIVDRLKQAGLFGVFVSLDSPDAAQHDENRHRPGLFQMAAEGIQRCQDAGILTGVSSYITRENLVNGRLADMMDCAKELGVLEVFLFDVIATGRLSEERQCMLTDEDIAKVKAFRERYNSAPDYPRIIHQSMFTSIAYPCAAEGCPAGVAQLHLRGNGDVTPCDFTPYAFGNLRDKSMKDIWQDITQHDIYARGSHRCRLASPEYWDQLEVAATSV